MGIHPEVQFQSLLPVQLSECTLFLYEKRVEAYACWVQGHSSKRWKRSARLS